jgi:hypothetical protein
MKAIVTQAWQATYTDPIELATGDELTLGRRDSEYPGWIWAACVRTCKSGWIPETLVQVKDDVPVARRDYSGRELTVQPGDILTIIDTLFGWHWAQLKSGVVGWVPANHVSAWPAMRMQGERRTTSPVSLSDDLTLARQLHSLTRYASQGVAQPLRA